MGICTLISTESLSCVHLFSVGGSELCSSPRIDGLVVEPRVTWDYALPGPKTESDWWHWKHCMKCDYIDRIGMRDCALDVLHYTFWYLLNVWLFLASWFGCNYERLSEEVPGYWITTPPSTGSVGVSAIHIWYHAWCCSVFQAWIRNAPFGKKNRSTFGQFAVTNASNTATNLTACDAPNSTTANARTVLWTKL